MLDGDVLGNKDDLEPLSGSILNGLVNGFDEHPRSPTPLITTRLMGGAIAGSINILSLIFSTSLSRVRSKAVRKACDVELGLAPLSLCGGEGMAISFTGRSSKSRKSASSWESHVTEPELVGSR